MGQEQLRGDLIEAVVLPVIPDELRADGLADNVFVNRTGSFSTGGPQADSGLTGRKIILRRLGAARGRVFQRQGPQQGGPQRHLYDALSG